CSQPREARGGMTGARSRFRDARPDSLNSRSHAGFPPVGTSPPAARRSAGDGPDPGGTMRQFMERGLGWEKGARLTRRQFGRMAALLTTGAALPFYNESALAQDLKSITDVPPDAVRINANENPMGPCLAALEAIRKIAPLTGRYLFEQGRLFTEAMAAAEGLPASHVLVSAGSS